MSENKDYHPGKLIRGSDGRVTRLFRCECGTPVYKKDLTNGTYEFLTKQDRGQTRMLIVKTGDRCDIKCPNPQCSLTHIILDYREGISTVDDFKTSVV